MRNIFFTSTTSYVGPGLTHTLWLGVLQLQNSRMVIQERDRVIKELEERVAFLEAEASTAGCLLFQTLSERSRLSGCEECGEVLWSRLGPIMQWWCLSVTFIKGPVMYQSSPFLGNPLRCLLWSIYILLKSCRSAESNRFHPVFAHFCKNAYFLNFLFTNKQFVDSKPGSITQRVALESSRMLGSQVWLVSWLWTTYVCRTVRCTTRLTTAWEGKGQAPPPTFQRSATLRLSTGKLKFAALSCRLLLVKLVDDVSGRLIL